MAKHAWLLVLVAACGGSSPGSASQQVALEHWETKQEWLLVSNERCVTGPFEIIVPDRPNEFGRRFVVEAFGDRELAFDTRRVQADASVTYGWGWVEDPESSEHDACRAHGESSQPLEAEEAFASQGNKDEEPSADEDRGQGSTSSDADRSTTTKTWSNPWTADPLPQLQTFDGAIPNRRTISGAVAWFPKGNPNVYAIDDVNGSYYEGLSGEAGFRFQFWFHRPVDTTGMVIRFRDQVLTPNGALDAYRKGFARRVAKAEAKKATFERSEYVDDTPGRGRVPPPLKTEAVPEAPDGNVEWLPGYWKFHAELDDFVWIGGTYVVRAKLVQSTTVDAVVKTDANVEAPSEPEISIKTPVQIEPSVPPQPPPKVEKIPKPPAVVGALWIPGYWELRSDTWHWVGGRWKVAKRGARFHAPSIKVRAGVKVYLPGGWSFEAR